MTQVLLSAPEGVDSERLAAIVEAIRLLPGILGLLSAGTLSRPVEIPEQKVDTLASISPLTRATTFYGLQTDVVGRPSADQVPFASLFEDLVSISSSFARLIVKQSADPAVRECLAGTLGLIGDLVSKVDERLKVDQSLQWDPVAWLEVTTSALIEV